MHTVVQRSALQRVIRSRETKIEHFMYTHVYCNTCNEEKNVMRVYAKGVYASLYKVFTKHFIQDFYFQDAQEIITFLCN